MTGVQTCALPIWEVFSAFKSRKFKSRDRCGISRPICFDQPWLVKAIGYRVCLSFGVGDADDISGLAPFGMAFGLSRSGKDRTTKTSSDGWVSWKGRRVFGCALDQQPRQAAFGRSGAGPAHHGVDLRIDPERVGQAGGSGFRAVLVGGLGGSRCDTLGASSWVTRWRQEQPERQQASWDAGTPGLPILRGGSLDHGGCAIFGLLFCPGPLDG